MKNKISKREFIKLMGLGSLGLIYWQCYDSKKETVNNLISDEEPSEDSETDEITLTKEISPVEFTDDDVIFLTRNDESFDKLRKGYNLKFNRFPDIIALCKTTEGVQAAVQKARAENLKISVKSGGHSFESFSCTDDSLMINLSQMNKITWIDNENVILQPACLLKDIYDNFLPRKRVIPTGSCGTVGIAGLALGGGYGFFSRKYGLTCDSLTRIKIVNGNGEVLDSDENPELLWACKGGGNGNFGVVTELHFKTYSAPPTFSSYRLKFRNLDTDRFMKLIRTWFEFTSTLRKEAFSAFVLNGKTLTILVTNWQKHNPEFEETFSELRKMADDYSPTYDQEISRAFKRYYGNLQPIYFKNASAGFYSGVQDVEEILPQVFEKITEKKRTIIYQINTLGGEINNPGFEAGSSYPHRKYDYLSELQCYWDRPSQEEDFVRVFDEIQSIFNSIGIKNQYRNYPNIKFPNWETAYYGDNYSKLQDTKMKLDPEDLFSFEQSIKLK